MAYTTAIVHYKSDEHANKEAVQALREKQIVALQAINDAKTKKEEEQAHRLLHDVIQENGRLEAEALKAYVLDAAGDYEKLLADAKFMIKQIDENILADVTLLSHNRLAAEGRLAKQYSTKNDTLAEEDKKAIFEDISVETRSIILGEQYEAARYAFENQTSLDGTRRNFPERTLDEYTNFTSDISELAEKKIEKVIKSAGGILALVFAYTDTPAKRTPADTDIEPVKRKTPIIPELIRRSRYSMLNNKIANSYSAIQDHLLTEDANGQLRIIQEQVEVEVSNKKSVVTVTSLVSLNYTGELSAKVAKLTAYDRVVLNTICSLYLADNRIVTISSIFKTMNHTDKEPKKSQKGKIRHSLEKLNNHIITIDFSNEAQNDYLDAEAVAKDDRIVEYSISDRLVNFRVHRIKTTRGTVTDAIEILSEPTLLTYSLIKKNKQIITIPAGMLNVEGVVNITDDVIVIKEYLAKQTRLISEGERNKKLLFDTIYKECDLKPKDKTEAKRYRDTITKILDEWKGKGYITAYNMTKQGKSIDGVEIMTDKNKLKAAEGEGQS